MGIDKTQLATDLGYMIADLPSVMTYAGVTYAVVFTDVTDGSDLELGGFAESNAAQAFCKFADFSTVPVSGVTVSIDGNRYRVSKATKSPDGAGLRLDLENPER
jgi:hypothetical protein